MPPSPSIPETQPASRAPRLDLAHLQQWIGRTESVDDSATLTPLRALSATLDHDAQTLATGSEFPPCWHWLYFLPLHRQSELGADGHARRGGFLPPVPLPRRMWAGSRLDFFQPIRAGDTLRRESRIADVQMKQGRRGPLVFVTVAHEILANGQLAIDEQHDIVYRNNPAPDEPAPPPVPAPDGAQWTRTVVPDDTLLFRYSALTFNTHRIHYDRRYVTQVEGYPGLIVHGPLIATLLLDLLRRERPDARVGRFSFKAMHPIFDIAPFEVCGTPQADGSVRLWARTPQGHLAMDAQAQIEV